MNWQFDTRSVDDDIGWNNALITSFKNIRLKSLACEIFQNSLDNPSGADDTVRIVFSEKQVPAEKLPDIPGLASHIKACATENALKTQNDDSRGEIREAKSVVEKKTISILEVADFNTTGMEGPDIKTKAFHSYMKTEGNASGGNQRGGSHGHGKAAPLALSTLRSILVSTAWKDENGSLKKLFQGRSTLMTHQVGDQNFDYKGYLGGKNFKAVESLEKKYSWLEREDETGTTIRLLGWMSPPNWAEVVVGYAISIYFSAILRGKLELEVGNLKLSKDTFYDFLNDQAFLSTVKKYDENCHEEIELARWFARCLDEEDHNVIRDEKQIHRLGRCSIKLVIDDDAPRRFGVLRNDILITSSLSTFYKRHPSIYKPYVGLVECSEDNGYELLRRMEPPQHNNFTPDMLQESDKETGRSALKNLGNGLKDVIKKFAQYEIEHGSEVAWMADFFGDPAGDGQDVDDSEDIDPSGVLLFTPKPKTPPPPKSLWDIEAPPNRDLDDEEGDDEEDLDTEGDDEGEEGPRPKPDGDDEDAESGSTIHTIQRPVSDVIHTRFITKASKNGTLIIRAEEKGSHRIEFYEVGADLLEPLEVLSLEGAITNGGELFVPLSEGVNKIEVSFKHELLGGIKTILSKV